jgi:hypothetical protein
MMMINIYSIAIMARERNYYLDFNNCEFGAGYSESSSSIHPTLKAKHAATQRLRESCCW